MGYWDIVRPETEIETIKDSCDADQTMFAVVSSDNTYQGYITLEDIDLCETEGAETAWDVLDSVGKIGDRNVFVYDTDPADTAKRRMRERKLQFIPVIDQTRHFLGTIDKDSTS